MLIHIGSAPAYVVSSAEVAEEIMRVHDIAFANRLESRIYKRLLYDCKDLLMAPYGEYWKQMRGLCASKLLSAARVQSLQYIRDEEAKLLGQEIRTNGSYPFNLSGLLQKVTNDIICRASFGKRYSQGMDHNKLNRVFRELNALLGLFNIGEYIPWLDWLNHVNGVNKRVEKNHKELDELLEEIISDGITRRALNTQTVETNLLDTLLDIQDGSKDGLLIIRESIKAIVLDIFVGGSDTTYVVLEWAMSELQRHPEVLRKVQQEIRGIVGSKSQVTKDDLAKMNYLKAVLKESMRLHPSVPLIPRVSSQDVKVHGYNIPAKTRVLINIWAIGTDPALWEQPREFIPERFLKNGEPVDFHNSHDFKWMAFGGGRRGCPGELFGMALVEFILATLLHNFDWALPEGAKGRDLDMTEFIALALNRMHPLVVVATPHTS